MPKNDDVIATYSFGGASKPFAEHLLLYLYKKLQEKEKASRD